MSAATRAATGVETTPSMVGQLYTDMYIGRGKENPPVTVRLDRLEQCTEEIVANSKATRTMMLGTMLTVIGSVIAAFICSKLGWHI